MSKIKVELQHEGIEYINSRGHKVKADFRETDAMNDFLKSQRGNRESSDAGFATVRVFRRSELGENPIARFVGPADEAKADAEAFARRANENYRTYGMYTAYVK